MKEEEIWKNVTSYPGIQASSLGRIRSTKKIRSLYLSPLGYYSINISIAGVQKTEMVHRLVAMSFIPNPYRLRCVNHKNAIKTDNRMINLEWVSYSMNNKHAYEMGVKVSVKGTDTHSNKLDEVQVKTIKTCLISGIKIFQLARYFSVARSTISAIKYNRKWKHITI